MKNSQRMLMATRPSPEVDAVLAISGFREAELKIVGVEPEASPIAPAFHSDSGQVAETAGGQLDETAVPVQLQHTIRSRQAGWISIRWRIWSRLLAAIRCRPCFRQRPIQTLFPFTAGLEAQPVSRVFAIAGKKVGTLGRSNREGVIAIGIRRCAGISAVRSSRLHIRV